MFRGVAAMQIDHTVRQAAHMFKQHMRQDEARRPGGVARKDPVDVLPVHRHQKRLGSFKAEYVHEREHGENATDVPWRCPPDDPRRRLDARVIRPMNAGEQHKRGPRFAAVDDRHRQGKTCHGAIQNRHGAPCFLAGPGRDGTYLNTGHFIPHGSELGVCMLTTQVKRGRHLARCRKLLENFFRHHWGSFTGGAPSIEFPERPRTRRCGARSNRVA